MANVNTVRVLSLDGGGMRGYVSATFLKKFIDLWGINANEIYKYFDVITGSSIGGIQALSYSIGMSPTEVLEFFTQDGPYIFTTSSSTPSSRPSTLTKGLILFGTYTRSTFYPSTTSGIGTMQLKSKLDSTFGTQTMQDCKTATLITSFEKNDTDPDFAQDTNTPVYFSNSNVVPSLTGQNFNIVDVAMATSAAPVYFPAWQIGNDKYIDGGVVQNNPASLGLAVGKALKPAANRFCVLSVGTGLGDVGFADNSNAFNFKKRALKEAQDLKTDPDKFAKKWNIEDKKEMELLLWLSNNLGLLEGASLIMYLLGAMTTGPQEIAAKELHIESEYTLDNLYNYRMQYYFDPTKDTELDNSTSSILSYYSQTVDDYFNNNIDNITAFLGHLTA